MRVGRQQSESDAYRKVRDELVAAEMALRDQRERVAELRRRLPLEPVAEDYRFKVGPDDLSQDAPVREVRLSELFVDPSQPLVFYQYMYGGAQNKPCPMCTLWTDGLNGIARHVRRWGNFAIVAQAELEALRAWARERGWSNLRLVSSAGSSFKSDFGFQDGKGGQLPGVSVFVRTDQGVRHFYSCSAILDDKFTQFRGLDLLSPLWHLMDLTPAGRSSWMPSVSYPAGLAR